MAYRLSGGVNCIRWDEVRARAEFAGDALDIPRDEVEALLRLPGTVLNEADDILDFCERNGLSLDWLIRGDTAALLHHARPRLTR